MRLPLACIVLMSVFLCLGCTREKPLPTVTLTVEQYGFRMHGAPEQSYLAIRFSLPEGWHIYWKEPGETGLATEFDLHLSTAKDTPLQWNFPVPQRYSFADIESNIYEGEVIFLSPLPDALPSDLRLQGTVSWLLCSEDLCIPDEQQIDLPVPASKGVLTDTMLRHQFPSKPPKDLALCYLSAERSLRASKLQERSSTFDLWDIFFYAPSRPERDRERRSASTLEFSFPEQVFRSDSAFENFVTTGDWELVLGSQLSGRTFGYFANKPVTPCETSKESS